MQRRKVSFNIAIATQNRPFHITGTRCEEMKSSKMFIYLFIYFFIYLPQNTNNNKIKQNSNTKAKKSGEEAQKKPWGL